LELQRERDEMKLKQLEEMKEKEREEMDAKKQEEYLNKLEKFKMKTKEQHEEVERLRTEWKSKQTVERSYRYQTVEEEFKLKQERKEEERHNKALQDLINKRKTLLKPLSKAELDENSQKVMQEIQSKKYEREKQRLLKQEELMKSNELLPRSDTNVYRQMVKEDKKNRNHLEQDKLDKLYNQLKIKNFSKEVKENLLPEIDENKKKEREYKIIQMENKKVEKHKRKRGGRVLLQKPKQPYKYQEGMSKFLEEERIKNELNERKARSKSARSLDNEPTERYDYKELQRRLQKSRSHEKKVPMEKAPDYLTEMRKVKEQEVEKQKREGTPEERTSKQCL
jgi:hypothetical protein